MSAREERLRRKNLQTHVSLVSEDLQRNISHFTPLCSTRGASCNKQSHAALVQRLLTYCNDLRTSRNWMRSYSQRCYATVVQHLESKVKENCNVFETGINAYGMWWLANKGAVRTSSNIKGLLHINADPWMNTIHISNLKYYEDESIPVHFVYVKYVLGEGGDVQEGSYWYYHSGDSDNIAYPYPTSTDMLPTMSELIEKFSHNATASGDLKEFGFASTWGFNTSPMLLLMFFKILNEETNGPVHHNRTGWEIDIHRFPDKPSEVVLWQTP